MPKLKDDVIHAAIEGFQQQKVTIDARIAELRAMLSGGTPEALTAKPKRRRRKMSAAARKAIGDATRKRWAAKRAAAKK